MGSTEKLLPPFEGEGKDFSIPLFLYLLILFHFLSSCIFILSSSNVLVSFLGFYTSNPDSIHTFSAF